MASITRDYYQELFSPDTQESFLSLSSHVEDESDIPDFGCEEADQTPIAADSCDVDNIERLLQELNDQFELDNDESADRADDAMCHTIEEFPTYNDDAGSTPLVGKVGGDDDSVDSNSSELEFLSEEAMVRLLQDDSEEEIVKRSKRYFQHSPDPNQHEASMTDESSHRDKIGTFNIQNQYDHSLAAKLFLEEEFTFLAFQEPFASHTSIGDAWGACRRYELSSARIACFETHHQVILYDSWRWGGKLIDNFSSLLDGRIISMAFGFNNDQCLGIISLYGVAMGGPDADHISRKNDLRRTIIFAIRKIQKQWKKRFPNINIMILGDLQETVTTSDLDNLGKCRYNLESNVSILKSMSSFTSVVRDNIKNPNQYLTRFGSEGARGIDHILFPNHRRAQDLISNTGIDGILSSFYFPSDHKLIYCSFLRDGPNNEEEGELKTNFLFRDIYQIKLSRIESKGDVLTLDPSQFKDCMRFRKQAELYSKLQDLTGDNSEATHHHLKDVELSIQKLYKSLLADAQRQHAHGANNSLVEISDRQAAELSGIVNRFDAGIKDIMHFLDLSSDQDRITDMARTRKQVRKDNSFKIFSNLPMSTKLRYLRNWVKEKHRKIKRYTQAIKEYELVHRVNGTSCKHELILRNWGKNINACILQKKARNIHSRLLQEFEERDRHVEAISSRKRNSRAASEPIPSLLPPSLSGTGGNDLNLSEKTVKLINFWLSEAGCAQGFNTDSNKDKFSFLLTDMDSWLEHIRSIDTNQINWNCTNSIKELRGNLDSSASTLAKLEKKIGLAQRTYRANTIEYLLKVNKIEDFTQKVRPKSREAPATHTEIWDRKLQTFRPCRNEIEELAATGEHHGRWMGNSEASEICAFAKLERKGLLGVRGVTLSPDRKITFDDIPKLVKNGDKLSNRDKRAFIAAHGRHTADLFKAKDRDHKELHYPFYLLQGKVGAMHKEEEVAEMFWKSIASVPGKARYDGFQMAVVGRLGCRWQKCLFNICKLILTMRFIPKRLKSIARFPIPKPGKVNEYRPISLCHDMYCFINSISTKFSSQGIMDAGILHAGIAAYVKGKGCAMLVGVEQGIREDCLESGIPMSQTDEDEEKFFDRIPVEILLAAMRVNGFPTQGFIELKASGMGAKTVEIITSKGIAHARFVCGLEQGNPDSPTIANLVIKFKHDIWCNILHEIEENSNNSLKSDKIGRILLTKRNQDAYRFHISDKADGIVRIDRIGYCDDNTRYTSSMNEDEVILATQRYIKRSGDLSLVTKIGRKGSKSEIHFYNLSAEKALTIEQTESFAWSFVTDGPIWEKVPHKIQLQKQELSNAFKLVGFHNLEEEEQQKFLKVFQPKAHKHLGLSSTLSGNSESASKAVLNKIKGRLASLKLYTMDHEAQRVCSNMLCTTVHSYATLQMSHPTKALLECDKTLISHVMKRKGLSTTDAKHCIFLDESSGGYGFKSFLEVDLISNARELEIVLNGAFMDSEVIRARAAAFLLRHDRPDEDTVSNNFTGYAINKLADYGIHLRDSQDGLVNFILSHYNNFKTLRSVGDSYYKVNTGFSIGLGKQTNRKIAFGSVFHVFLKRAFTEHGEVKPNLAIPEDMNPKISINTLKRLAKIFKEVHFENTAASYNFWEWKNSLSKESWSPNVSDSAQDWVYFDFVEILKNKFPSCYWKMSTARIHAEVQMLSAINNRHPELAKFIKDSALVPFISTDGSHLKKNHRIEPASSTASSAVLCMPDIKQNELSESLEWADRVSIPILARIAKLPVKYGSHETDIAHGEAAAICMGLEMFEKGEPRVLIVDSAAVRSVTLGIRDRNINEGINRTYIRKLISGVSKHLCARMEESLRSDEEIDAMNLCSDKMNHTLRLCTQWIKTEGEKNANTEWKETYFDKHDVISIFKVDSHQLNCKGTGLKAKKRYPNIVPNLFITSCNHHADRSAELPHSAQFQHKSQIKEFVSPDSKLRFFFCWNGQRIDRHISSFLEKKFQLQKLAHIRSKATQGLPWRIIPNSTTKWTTLAKMGGLFRSLRGLSRSHTRSLYKSQIYRKGWIKDYEATHTTHQNGNRLTNIAWIKELSACKWCSNIKEKKGNRTHAQLFCQHDKLQRFRTHMTQLIEQNLTQLIKIVHETQSIFSSRLFLQEVESTLRNLHDLRKPDDHDHTAYRTRTEWMREEGESSWTNLLQSTIPIYSAIFGFSPVMEEGIPSDALINRANCIPFGVIPIELEQCFKKMCQNAKTFYSDTVIYENVTHQYKEIWERVKELNLARTIGLHRIIGGISKEMEKEFRIKYEFNEGTFRAIKKALQIDRNPGQKLISILKRKGGSDSGEGDTRKRKKVKFHDSAIPKKLCTGITCGIIHAKWNLHANTPNYIQGQQKHCLRCSKQSTAVRKSAVILKHCQSSDRKREREELLDHLDSTMTDCQVASISTRLHNFAPKDSTTESPTQKKHGKRTDADKLLMKTIAKCITRQTDRASPPDKRISTAIRSLDNMNKDVETFLKNDLKRYKRIQNNILSERSYNQKNIITKRDDIPEIQSTNEKMWTSSTFQNSQIRSRIQTRGYNQLVGSDAIQLAIMNLRMKAPNSTFIGNAATSKVILTCRSNRNWLNFAPCFGTTSGLNKPHGIYLLPLFSGPSDYGHWTLGVVEKQKKYCRAWMIDSLGKGDAIGELADTIKKLFSRARVPCKWIPTSSIPQSENECGPRMLQSMAIICDVIKEGGTIENAIDRSSLMGDSRLNYDPTTIRENAANLMSVSEEIKVSYNRRIMEMRRALRRNKNSSNNGTCNQKENETILEIL